MHLGNAFCYILFWHVSHRWLGNLDQYFDGVKSSARGWGTSMEQVLVSTESPKVLPFCLLLVLLCILPQLSLNCTLVQWLQYTIELDNQCRLTSQIRTKSELILEVVDLPLPPQGQRVMYSPSALSPWSIVTLHHLLHLSAHVCVLVGEANQPRWKKVVFLCRS